MASRRKFVKDLSAIGLGTMVWPHTAMGFSPLKNADKLKIGIIGVGLRGTEHLKNLLLREDIEVTAICDIDSKRISIANELIQKAGMKLPKTFGNDELDYRNLLSMEAVEAVIIATPWSWHVPMSVDAMRARKYTGVEVSAATTMEGCWDLVNTHLETGTHLMILENVNYRRDVLAVLNMVKKGIFGELVHFRCGYQHDLREVKFNDGKQPYGGG
ncbi:MAG: Gfo/Idh/MocA family oxidoreductase, partial [Flavobacteriaceae bacterium]